MSGHEQHDDCNNCTVKYKASQSVRIKQCFSGLFLPEGIDHMEDHRQKNQSHTDGDRHNKYGVECSDHRQIRHCLRRAQPQRRDPVLKAKYTAIEESENCREESAARKNCRQVDLFKMVQ